jgi:16S rRNA (adenine1518-N6/adenine1519-N6)-dimethyltransferase
MKRHGARLGQHFLTGRWAAAKLTEAAGITALDTVLEIGPGTGALTRELLATGAHVIAIEKDEALVEKLRGSFAQEISADRFTLISDDVRNFVPEKAGLEACGYILAANIPYYITGEIIRQFLSTDAQPKTMAILIQKEVAQRICARDGKESILSVSVKAYGAPTIAAKVPRGNFSPPPSVDSAILVVNGISKTFFVDIDEAFFFTVVRAGFASKRKFLASNLAVLFTKLEVQNVFAACDISPKVRAEELGLEQWKKISLGLSERHK